MRAPCTALLALAIASSSLSSLALAAEPASQASVRFRGRIVARISTAMNAEDPIVMTQAARGRVDVLGRHATLSLRLQKPGWAGRVPFFRWRTLTQTGRVAERDRDHVLIRLDDTAANRERAHRGMGGGSPVSSSTGTVQLHSGAEGAAPVELHNAFALDVPGWPKDWKSFPLTWTVEGQDLQVQR